MQSPYKWWYDFDKFLMKGSAWSNSCLFGASFCTVWILSCNRHMLPPVCVVVFLV